jgi:hypothetical protein
MRAGGQSRYSLEFGAAAAEGWGPFSANAALTSNNTLQTINQTSARR